MKHGLREKSLLKQGVTGASSSSETLGQKDPRYFSDQPPYCGFIWPLLCPQKRQIRGLLPLVRITMIVKRYQWLGLLLTLRGVRRKCSQRRKMGWGLRQASGEINWSPVIFDLCPGKGEFELLNAQPLQFQNMGNLMHLMSHPNGSDGKESNCNAGDLGLITGSGRAPEERNVYSLQYSWLENPRDRGAWWATVHSVAKSQAQLSN